MTDSTHGTAVRSRFAADLQSTVSIAIRFADCALVALVAIVAYWLRHDTFMLPGHYLAAVLLAVALTAQFLQSTERYEFPRLLHVMPQISRLSGGWSAVILALIAIAFLTKTSDAFSRGWLLVWFSVTFAGFVALRVGTALMLRHLCDAGRFRQQVVIVGAGDYGQRLVRQLVENADGSLEIMGIFDRRTRRVPTLIAGVPVLGNFDDMVRFIRANRVDEIIVALPWGVEGTLSYLLRLLKTAPVNVKWCPEAIGFQLPVRSLSNVAGVPMVSIFDRPLSGRKLLIKAAEDRLGATALLLLTTPIILLAALALRYDSPGPTFFRQKRFGFNNNEFTVFKLRTMHVDTDGGAGVRQATPGDARVTRVGRFLRRTSIDELPQLLNVLRGEMSLVGPRPHAIAHNEQYAALIDEYLERHRVKPGITGWAQVNGLRGATETAEKMRRRVHYDLHYIDNWSLLFDLRILVMTLFVGFTHDNAY